MPTPDEAAVPFFDAVKTARRWVSFRLVLAVFARKSGSSGWWPSVKFKTAMFRKKRIKYLSNCAFYATNNRLYSYGCKKPPMTANGVGHVGVAL